MVLASALSYPEMKRHCRARHPRPQRRLRMEPRPVRQVLRQLRLAGDRRVCSQSPAMDHPHRRARDRPDRRQDHASPLPHSARQAHPIRSPYHAALGHAMAPTARIHRRPRAHSRRRPRLLNNQPDDVPHHAPTSDDDLHREALLLAASARVDKPATAPHAPRSAAPLHCGRVKRWIEA